MQRRHNDRRTYFNELAITSEKYFLPYLKQFIEITPNMRVLEIGCGDGGNLLPFARIGCEVTGIDIATERIEQAKIFFTEEGERATLISDNIYNVNNIGNNYDVILIHDVIEHIEAKYDFMNHIKQFMNPNTTLFIGFPAWQMPFGGHQQICHGKWVSRLPFIHLLPKSLYRFILRGEKDSTIEEMMYIKKCKTTIEKFEKLTKRCDFDIKNRQLYFINPHYEIKFGLRPVVLHELLSRIRYIRNYFSTSCFYLMKIGN